MPKSAPTDLDSAMARLAGGDRGAFTIVFRALWPAIRGLCGRSLGGPAADAEDAAQLAMEKIFARASDYDPERPALPWAMAIAAWECRTLRQRARRSKEQLDPDGAPGRAATSEHDPERAAIDASVEATLGEVFLTLSPADRETLRAAFWEEHAEVASGPTFRKRKERALTRLRAAVKGLFDD